MEQVGFLIVLALALVLAIYALRLRRQISELELQRIQERRLREAIATHAESMTARASAVGQAVDDAVMLVNPAREVVYLNDAARGIFADGEPVGRRVADVAWGFDLGPLLENALAGRAESIQQTVVRDQRAYMVRARPIGPHGEYGAAFALEDVTELQRLGRARRDFVANISHDLRTPLASVKLLVDTLAKGALNDPRVAPDLLTKIDTEVDALRQLADELFELAQIESGQAPIKLVTADVGRLIERAVERFALVSERRNVKLVTADTRELRALVDPDKFAKVLGNLVHNAIKFTPPGGLISITARASDDMIQISVKDTGQGIPAQDLPRIFERFYKADRARDRGEKGTGLGLAIAKHIVEAHGGRIWADSIEGEGSEFCFTIAIA